MNVYFKTLSFLLFTLPFYAQAGDEAASRYVDTTSHPKAKLITAGEDLQKLVKLNNVKIKPVGHFVKGQVSVQNVSKHDLSLEYRVDWIDEDGFVLGDGGIWERFSISAHDIKRFKSVGKDRNAEKLQFTVRFPRDALSDPRNSKSF